MRWRPWIWFCVSLLCFVAAAYLWRLGDRWAVQKGTRPAPATNDAKAAARPATNLKIGPARLLSQPGNLNFPPPLAAKATNSAASPLLYRLSNNHRKTLGEFAHSDQAILLENALIDTTLPASLPIPDMLQAKGDPGSYIVQARGPIDAAFRSALKAAGAEIVAYIPNNAYLVRGSEAVAQQLRGEQGTQTVLPYEPYYKLKSGLLVAAMEQRPLPEGAMLNVLLFADARPAVLADLERLGVAVLGQERSPFGPVLKVLPPVDALATLAGLPGVQIIELARERVPANDLSRVAVGVAVDSVTATNYLGLTGTNIIVSVSDTGIDTNHPDLQGRVLLDAAASGVDNDGHGTHVAGIIAGSGIESITVSNASGSIMPAVAGQFRGKAPGATLLSLNFGRSDTYLQETAGRTNAVISNNSWTYGGGGYDLAAASYDAAVRDSLPMQSGSQPIVYVFPAGNGGGANAYSSGAGEGGIGGNADSIQSPGTAKNVITVGAVEQFRNITNTISVCKPDTNAPGGMNCDTNITPWVGSTDSSNQVASFSGRGNVGFHLEGDWGRFKPDVVAPGTFVVSTRSSTWATNDYYNPTNYTTQFRTRQLVLTNESWADVVYVPANAVQLDIYITASDPASSLFLYAISPAPRTFTGTNSITVPLSDLNPTDVYWRYEVSNNTPQSVRFDVAAVVTVTNLHGNFLDVLGALNDSLGRYYRYESGTSMAAGDASGTLALMAQFFQENLHATNSPALMKALLINGARSLGSAYNLQVQSGINHQGWGQVQLPNSIPAAITNLVSSPNGPSPLCFFDQNPTNALATGQSQTRLFTVSGAAQDQPLRLTLAWTDPPGNPAASLKLVNDLDLVVTNLNTGEVYFGNDIDAGNDYNLPWTTNNLPKQDVINNVENVYIRSPGGTNFSVTVIGHRVNVQAVSTDPDQVAQDYALVVSSGDGQVPDALTFQPNLRDVYVTLPNVFIVTNSFPSDPENPVSGGLLFHQHVGANSPLIGTNTVPLPTDANAQITLGVTNQWHFYVLSNDFNFTNASFVTFLPPELAVPRLGVTNYQDPANATRVQADIDMYVTTDPGLTNLSPFAIDQASKSLTPGGTEFVVFSNAAPRSVYYVGIKSEDQMAADYSFLGVFSLLPPTSTDTNGNRYLRGMPVPAAIPPGTPPNPQAALVIGLDVLPTTVRRVVVNPQPSPIVNRFDVTHTMPGSLIGNLSHNQKFAVLNNHTCVTDAAGDCYTNWYYRYEDNGEGNVPGARPSDGPGSLKEFIGEEGLGVWLLTMVSDYPASSGAINRVIIKLEPQSLNTNGIITDILPNTWHYDSIDVPGDATNLTVCVSGNSAPVELYVRRGSLPTATDFDHHLTINPPGDCLPITIFDDPPLTAGRYYIGVFNGSSTVQSVRITAFLYKNPYAVAASLSSFAGPVPIADDAITYAYITNLVHMTISALDVGLLINHPRISDLAITLVSPAGTRVLLFEDRGAASTNGLGTFSTLTNSLGVPMYAYTNLTAFYTNNFDDVAAGPYAPGAVFDGWNVLSNYALVYPQLPAPWLSNNVLILADSAVSNSLPTTNSTAYSLSFRVTHAPYLVGTVAWWPLDTDGRDIFGGFDGLLSGDVLFKSQGGMVNSAFFGDGVATRMMVPGCADLDVGRRRGFSLEGWVKPLTTGVTVMKDGFENASTWFDVPAGTIISGWLVESGTVDVLSDGMGFNGLPDTGIHALDLNGTGPGSISTNFNTVVGGTYELSFAYSKNPNPGLPGYPDSVALADLALTGQPVIPLRYDQRNYAWALNWAHTSIVFTASSPVTKLQLTGVNPGFGGMYLDSFEVRQVTNILSAAPVMEWTSTRASVTDVVVWTNSFEGATGGTTPAGSYFADGWFIDSGDVDVMKTGIFGATADSGNTYVDLNGWNAGTISTNIALSAGKNYLLSFAYARNPDSVRAGTFPQAQISVSGTTVLTVSPTSPNFWTNLGWQTTSVVFTASTTTNRLQLQSLTPGASGVLFDSLSIKALLDPPPGVQFWLSGLPGTNVSGALFANLWDTNGQPHVLSTVSNSISVGNWQHVAVTYDAASLTASLYTNGQLAASARVSATNFLPNTAGDLYLGYHPGGSTNYATFQGGLDEFGLYSRALSGPEVRAIYLAGSNGKYGTNVLWVPVTNSVQLVTSLGQLNYTFVNGLTWTNGPQWETNTIYFNNLLGAAYPNGPATNFTSLIITNLDQNAALDDFVLSAVLTNYVNGLMHFTENTNVAKVPIKFAPWPYMASNFPPTLVFSNDFELATQGVYQAGSGLPGTTNSAAFGPRNWTVVNGPITVVSNTLVDAAGSNCVALAMGAVSCPLPTIPGHRYQLTYAVRGPGAVSWWSGDIEPLSQRAWDLIGGNHGAFIHGATNSAAGLVNALGDFNALALPGIVDPTNGYSSKIEVGDPANLRLTNAFTIEGWVRPLVRTNVGIEQILFRGDSRDCLDPYYLALRRVEPDKLTVLFHIENSDARDCGITLETVQPQVFANGEWTHIAAVFESGLMLTNATGPTNQLRLYINGRHLRPEDQAVALQDPLAGGPWNDLTARFPFADLDPGFSPGVSIGNRSRNDYSQPFRGLIDELSVYGRALTDAEIATIAAAGAGGKADFRATPAMALGKVNAFLDTVLIDTGNGDNAEWTTRTFTFTADRTNLVLTLQSVLPGTLIDGVTLTELPQELNYFPEESLSVLDGEDAYGVWKLEIWDTRSGAFLTNVSPSLLQWELNFVLQPSNAPPVVHLEHGIPYTNLLTAHGLQNFVVNVPQWALNATNILLYASDLALGNPQAVGVLYNLTNPAPTSTANALFWPPVPAGVANLNTTVAAQPYIVPGQPYYLTVTNPNPFAVSFAYGVWFDITSLTNCTPVSNYVWQAGIPRYFQFDVPTNAVPPGAPPVQATLYLTGAGTNSVGFRSNVTVVVSQHLPLPDLTHYDFFSRQPSTNDDIVFALTNTTAFPIQDGRWYVGVFSSAATTVPFTIQACYTTSNYPVIVPLTNGVPFVADLRNPFVAPPGPPRWFFFEFELTNYVDAVLFELYNLSGDADLVLQRDVPPGMAPYFDGSFRVGTGPEQIVLRTGFELPDLRGKWFLGIYNNETVNVAYTLRAVTQQGGLLLSAQPLVLANSTMPPPHGLLLQWNSVIGEYYEVQASPSLTVTNWQTVPNGIIQATTPLTTFEVPLSIGTNSYLRVVQVPANVLPLPTLQIRLSTNNMVRISWPVAYPGETLQSAPAPTGPWSNVNRAVVIEGGEFVVYDLIGTEPKFYRLIP